ncbi:hypothetical protein BDL97_17G103400 [Sphagnum fallax]|nr:hypothetical protein BDL97_17G103400 [Sphagnum fallax]KAH8936795.1 hypothetical protein BDL97_17G103400 [Sphagnum fallax]KAH8936796.1 hypothetical protein BDL97_17G103400 [Sphagnum fallax]
MQCFLHPRGTRGRRIGSLRGNAAKTNTSRSNARESEERERERERERVVLSAAASTAAMAFSRLQSASMVAGFSALSAWYGFMFGKETARKELVDKINELKDTIHKLQSGN